MRIDGNGTGPGGVKKILGNGQMGTKFICHWGGYVRQGARHPRRSGHSYPNQSQPGFIILITYNWVRDTFNGLFFVFYFLVVISLCILSMPNKTTQALRRPSTTSVLAQAVTTGQTTKVYSVHTHPERFEPVALIPINLSIPSYKRKKKRAEPRQKN